MRIDLESDIKVMTNTIQELDAKKQEAIANLNALHGAKQQCESFLKELDNDDQTASMLLFVMWETTHSNIPSRGFNKGEGTWLIRKLQRLLT